MFVRQSPKEPGAVSQEFFLSGAEQGTFNYSSNELSHVCDLFYWGSSEPLSKGFTEVQSYKYPLPRTLGNSRLTEGNW